MYLLLATIIILFMLFYTRENFILEDTHYPYAHHNEYIKDLEPGSVRILREKSNFVTGI